MSYSGFLNKDTYEFVVYMENLTGFYKMARAFVGDHAVNSFECLGFIAAVDALCAGDVPQWSQASVMRQYVRNFGDVDAVAVADRLNELFENEGDYMTV